MYRQGQGVSRDYDKAVKWFRNAANQGFAYAQFNLGLMYANGNGVPQEIVQAYVWFSLAAAQGHEYAKQGQDKTSNLMTPRSDRRGPAHGPRVDG